MQEEGELVGEQGVLLVPCRADAVAAVPLHAQHDRVVRGRGRLRAGGQLRGLPPGTRGSFMPAVSKTAGYGVPSRTWR